MSKKLKPCPFCGSEAEHESTVTQETINCTLCHCSMIYDGSGAALIAMRNTRTDSEEVERLKAQLSEAVELLRKAEYALEDVSNTFNYGVYEELENSIEQYLLSKKEHP